MNRLSLLLLASFSLAGCQAANDLIHEPPVTDPLDGYRGSLSQAGINTEMDYGPKQSSLMNEYQRLRDERDQLQRQVDKLTSENANLLTQLGDERTALAKEKSQRAQSESETELLRQRKREYEARILSLSIEKAKLEQSQLLSRLEALREALEPGEAGPTEAAATPPRQR